MTRRFFTGHESWVFRAHALEELCGFHPELIGQVLDPGARIEYLLYSPLREVDGVPFGLKGPCGSHALAVTSDAFIISRDSHRPSVPRTLSQIPFSSILAIELGEALTLGWLVIRFAVRRAHDGPSESSPSAALQIASETVFFQSSGIDHFRAALRAWRGRTAGAAGDSDVDAWQPVWTQSPLYLRTQLAPLILDHERPRAVLHAAETWYRSESRRTAACVSPAALCAVTDHAVFLAQSARPYRPGDLVFGVNVTCLDRRVIRDAIVRTSDSGVPPTTSLAIDLGISTVQHSVVVTLGQSDARDVERVVSCLRRTPSAESRIDRTHELRP